MFFYSDTQPRSSTPINWWKMNGTNGYMRHYENYLFLHFMIKNGTPAERKQAEAELIICKRKLDRWEKHPNTDKDELRRRVEKMNKDWKGKRAA